MPYFAQIDNDGNCIGVSELRDNEQSPNLVPLSSFDAECLTKRFVGGSWQTRPKQVRWVITRFAFISRFTEDEWVELDLMGVDDKAMTPAQRRNAAKLRRYLKLIESAKNIDLKQQKTRDGVLSAMQVLQAAGIVTDAAARASVILDTEPTVDELA